MRISAEAPHDDLHLEADIDRYQSMCALAQTRAEAEMAWESLKQAVSMRSPERVAEMERERGLA